MKSLIFPRGYPKIIEMASGHLSLELSDRVSFDTFPEYATRFLEVIEGDVEERNDSIIMCIWDVSVNGKKYRLVYDDYPCGASLESKNDDSDNELIKIKERVMQYAKETNNDEP